MLVQYEIAKMDGLITEFSAVLIDKYGDYRVSTPHFRVTPFRRIIRLNSRAKINWVTSDSKVAAKSVIQEHCILSYTPRDSAHSTASS